ncbi:MAG: MFS transporter [Myxococcota bacterium]|nr:MFS transporter [Myxococcota bacterium]
MKEDLQGFARLIRSNADFRRLWISHMISMMGDWLSYIAVSVISVQQGGGAFAVGMVMFVHSIPLALMTPISGPLADRLDRKALLVGAYLGAFVLTVGMWGAATMGSVVVLQGVLFLRVCVSGLGITARSAAIPALVGREHLRLANALLGLTWSVMFTLGLALGGFASEVLSPSGAIVLDAMTFLLAASVALGLPSLKPEVGAEGPPRPGVADMLTAWRYVKARPRLLSTVLAKTPNTIANGGAWVTLNLVAGERLSFTTLPIAIGIMQCVRAIGSGVGPMLPASIIPRNPLIGTGVSFVGVAVLAGFESVALSVVGLALWGIGMGHNWVISAANLQAATPDNLLGRVTSLDFFLFSVGGAFAALTAGLLCDRFADPAVGTWFATALGVVIWAYCWSLSRMGPSDEARQP